jgi:transglutaminase-like putative cysteine protease
MSVPAPASRPLRLPWTALAATLVAYGAMFISARNLWLMAVLAAAVVLSYFVDARLEGRRLPRLLLRGALVAVIIVLNPENPDSNYEQFGPARTRNIFALVCAAEAALQFWRPRNEDPARPLLTALVASGMTLLSASNTFDERFIRWFAPLFLLFAALAARDYRKRAPAVGNGRRATTVLRSVALVLALGIGAGGHRAIIAYRGELMDWSNRLLFRDRFDFESTGMSQQPSLGPMFGLRGSPARVLRIEGGAGLGHWRGLAFYTYQRGQWGPPAEGRQWLRGGADLLRSARGTGAAVSATRDLTVTRLVNNNSLLYAPLSTVTLEPGDVRSVSWAPNEGGPLRARAAAPYEYAVSLPEDTDEASETYQGLLATPRVRTRADRARYLSVPTDEPEMKGVRDLAHRIAGSAPDAPRKIAAVVDYLLTNHPYSLRWTPSGRGQDPVADFLLTDPKKGAHCEFFAASAALLLRYQGIPTRYVTGYYAHEGAGEGVTVVRQRDAHAWCEAWVDGIGWVTVEATPANGRTDADRQPVEPWRRVYEWFQDRIKALADFVANLTPEQTRLAMGAVVAVAALYGAWRFYQRRRRAAGDGTSERREYTSPDATLAALARRFEAAWERQGGAPFPPSRTYAEHLRALARSDSSDAPAAALPPPETLERARIWAARYDAARFGGRFNDAARQELEDLFKEWEAPATR